MHWQGWCSICVPVFKLETFASYSLSCKKVESLRETHYTKSSSYLAISYSRTIYPSNSTYQQHEGESVTGVSCIPRESPQTVSYALPLRLPDEAAHEFASQRQGVLPTLHCTRRPRHLCSAQLLLWGFSACRGRWAKWASEPCLLPILANQQRNVNYCVRCANAVELLHNVFVVRYAVVTSWPVGRETNMSFPVNKRKYCLLLLCHIV